MHEACILTLTHSRGDDHCIGMVCSVWNRSNVKKKFRKIFIN